MYTFSNHLLIILFVDTNFHKHTLFCTYPFRMGISDTVQERRDERYNSDERYNTIPSPYHDFSSSTHSGLGDQSDEDIVSLQQRQMSTWTIVRKYWWLIDTTLLLTILTLLATNRWSFQTKNNQYSLTGDISGFAPSFSQKIVSFKPNPVFTPEEASEFWSNETQEAWLSIVPGMIL